MGRSVFLVLWVVFLGFFAGSPAFAANDRAMQFVLVRAAGDCGPACPEWISAEGEITKDTPAAFAAILRALGKRRPPIIIHSRGGRLDSAIALGRVVRRHGFDVAVGRTSFVDCVPGHSGCPKLDVSKGRVGRLSEYLFSGCASACVAVLAAGKNRVLLGRSVVGVHQIRNIRPEQTVTRYRIYYRTVNGRRVEVRREVIGKQHVKRQERTLKANDKTYKQVAAYFSLMGVAPELADWFHRAPPQGMHWLSNSDLSATKIVTLWQRPDMFLAKPQPPAAVPAVASMGAPPAQFPAGVLVTPPPPKAAPPLILIPVSLGTSELLVGRHGSRALRLVITFTLEGESRLVGLSVRPLIDGQDLGGSLVVLFEIEGARAFLALRPNGSSFLPLQSTIPLADFCLIRRGRPVSIASSLSGERAPGPIDIKRDAHPIYIHGTAASNACSSVP